MTPEAQKFVDTISSKMDSDGPMVGVHTLLTLELANLMHLAARQVPKERLTDYIHALSAHTISLATLISGRVILTEIQSLPPDNRAIAAYSILVLGDEEGSHIERRQHERLTLLREALMKDFPLTPGDK